MFQRQTTGSVVCPSCGKLVGVNDAKCFNCGRPYPGMWGFAPLLRKLGQDLGFMQFVIGACGVLYALTLVYDPGKVRMGGLFNFLSPSIESLYVFGASGFLPVFQEGRWWTVLSAGWLHGGLLHIGFNLYWVYLLAPAVAELYGAGRMVIIYTAGSVLGFALSSVSPYLLYFVPPLEWIMGGGVFTVGASAALFGLLGALVHYGRRGSGAVGRQALTYAVFLFVFGLVMRSIDNWAHLGGFLGGYLASHVMNPLAPERGDHMVVAVVCLVLSAAAVVASFVLP